jgi:alkaline phosphatase/alkaline phosphatase D
MRMKHHEQFSQPRFVDLFREVATYWEKDDHDYRFNDSDPVNQFPVRGGGSRETYPKTNLWPTYSGSGSQPSHELGLYVFREQMPIVDPLETKRITYRTHRVTRDLQVWFVEGRDYRSPNDMPDGPRKSIWGEQQKTWLKKTLLESDATFKIMVSPTPMVGPDSGNKRDSHVNLRGFRQEGDEFFRWLVANGFDKKNFYIVCGDRHWQYHALHPSGIEEFSVGALVAANTFAGVKPGTKNSTDPKGLIKHLHFNETPTAGFLIFTVKPGPPPSAVFDLYDKYGKHLYAAAKRAAAR